MLKDFKNFAFRGSVVDLAVGVIIGAAFGAIINSLVKDVIMPLLGIVVGGVNFTGLIVTVPSMIPGAPAVELTYGNFIQAVVNFLLIALSIFFMVKFITFARDRAQKEEPAALPKPTQEELLAEIRDLLRAQGQNGLPPV